MDLRERLSVCQVAVSTADLAGSLRLFDNVFGFQNSGGSALWGRAMRVTGLGEDARTLVWWMVGTQPFFQLEFFEYTNPRPAHRDSGAEPLGWWRIGIAVADFDRAITALSDFGVTVQADGASEGYARRASFREPFADFIVEIIEDLDASGPQVRYATQTVLDLAAATRLHGHLLGATIEPLGHGGFGARYGDFTVEVTGGAGPAPTQATRAICDYGIINLALATRRHSVAADVINRLQKAGHQATEVVENGDIVGTYFVDPGCEFEIFSLPEELDNMLGFCAVQPFVANMGF